MAASGRDPGERRRDLADGRADQRGSGPAVPVHRRPLVPHRRRPAEVETVDARVVGGPGRAAFARIGFRIGAERYLARLADGRIAVRRGPADGADVVFTSTAPTIAAAVYGGQPLRALAAAGALAIEGDRALADRFVTLFPLPPKVEASA
jgi:hypothetical protein